MKTRPKINSPYSSAVVDGVERAASRAMLHAIGFKRSDFSKPQIGMRPPGAW